MHMGISDTKGVILSEAKNLIAIIIMKSELQKICKKRRKTFLSQLPENCLAIFPNKPVSIRSNDMEYKFKPDTDFYYLTGFEEPNSICVLKKDKRSSTYILFVEPRDKEKEIWIGKRIGKEGAKSIFKADQAYLISEFTSELKKLLINSEHIFFPLGRNKELDLKITNLINELKVSNRSGINSPKSISDPRDFLHKMRLIKDKYEISCMEMAAEISKNAHILVLAALRPGMYEYEIEALLEYRFRVLGGGGPAYPSIVGSGNNSTILHYTRNNKKIKSGDLVLIDAGSEFNYYSSDLTRTYPATKKFNGIQKDVYEIVLEAQLSAIEQIKPGKRFVDSYNKAVQVLVRGLKELKLLKGSHEEIVKKVNFKKFFMHKLGHWLGLDVHDAGPYVDRNGSSIKLEAGMVMTVEPGIYIPSSLEDIPRGFKGIGVRIEDDVLVTKNGHKVLTSGVPKKVKEIEAFA